MTTPQPTKQWGAFEKSTDTLKIFDDGY